jgi:hypothetical protein
VPGVVPTLDYESVNAPVVMSPWEMREHMQFLIGEANPGPQLDRVRWSLMQLSRRWHALWSCYGEETAGWPRYRALLDEATEELAAQSAGLMLRNGIPMIEGLAALVLAVGLKQRRAA